MLFKFAYALGAQYARQKCGIADYEQDPVPVQDMGEPDIAAEEQPPGEEEIPPELLALLADSPGALEGLAGGDLEEEPDAGSAEKFVSFAQNDDTAEVADPNAEEVPPPGSLEEESPAWGGRTSLDAGDVGTRGHQMGLPTPGAV